MIRILHSILSRNTLFKCALLMGWVRASALTLASNASCSENILPGMPNVVKKESLFNDFGLIIGSENIGGDASVCYSLNTSENRSPIGVAMSGFAELTPSGITRITYHVVVKSYTTQRLEDVEMNSELLKVFDSNTQFTVFSPPKLNPKSTLKANTKFDGLSNTNLLLTGSVLEPGVQDTLTFSLSVFNADSYSKMYKNQVLACATIGEVDYEDLSVAGFEPDEDGDGDPGNDSGYTINLVDAGDRDLTQIKVIIPEGISPNGDGINDVFELFDEDKILDLSKFGIIELKIYNRWGSLVYESENYSEEIENGKGWSGQTNTGEMLINGNLPDGVYFYKLSSSNSTLFGGDYKVGSITLKR